MVCVSQKRVPGCEAITSPARASSPPECIFFPYLSWHATGHCFSVRRLLRLLLEQLDRIRPKLWVESALS